MQNITSSQQLDQNELQEMVNLIYPNLDDIGTGWVFKENAVAFVCSVYPAVVELAAAVASQHQICKIDLNEILKFSDYKKYCSLIEHPAISNETRQLMLNYIRTRSGFNENLQYDMQPPEVTKVFDFANSYISRVKQ